MNLSFARTTRERQAQYEDPIRFARGAVLEVKRRDEEWTEFFWCRAPDGREGWVHQDFFRPESGDRAVATRDYDAVEHSFGENEWMQPLETLNGWSWCRDAQGRLGWVRVGDLKPFAAPQFQLRPIEARDDARVAAIIRTVMPEYGAVGDGFAINDPEVDYMSRAYAAPRSAYFVVTLEGLVCGGGGIAPLIGGDAGTCELRKMYFLPQLRGRGAGSALIALCLSQAREFGFQRCYLETLSNMKEAQRLYERHGFAPLSEPLGDTGHGGCNRFYALAL